MLVLSRKAGEKLVIGEDVVIEVVRIQGNRVTLGIKAPDAIKVLRAELKQTVCPTGAVELVVEDGLLVAC